jgi:RHS repeat-associated protein
MSDVMAITGGENPDEIRDRMLAGLNRLIRGVSLYTENPANPFFSQVTKSAHTLELLQSDPVGYDLMRLNRALLADAYRGQLWHMRSEQSGYAHFMAGLATSSDDAYIASSSGIANILTRMASSVCARKPPTSTLGIELGSDLTIFLGQQVAVRAAPRFPDGNEPEQIESHGWRQFRSSLEAPSIGPASQPTLPPALAIMDIDGANDPEVIVHDFPELGDYVLQVEARGVSGSVAQDTVTIHVISPPPPGESYEDVEYAAVFVQYDFVKMHLDISECGQDPTGGYGYPPINVFRCHHDPRLGVPCWLVAGHGSPGQAILANQGLANRPTYQSVCQIIGDKDVWIRTHGIRSKTVFYTFGPNGMPIIQRCQWGWPNTDCFQLPDQDAGGLSDMLGAYAYLRPRFVGLQTEELPPPDPVDPCAPGVCANWTLLDDVQPYSVQSLSGACAEIDGGASDWTLGFAATYQVTPEGAPWGVNAGPDQNLSHDFGEGGNVQAQLAGTVMHRRRPGVPFIPTWSLVSGPSGSPDFTPVQGLAATASLQQSGTYVFMLKLEEVNDPACPPENRAASDFIMVHVNGISVDAGPDQVVDFDSTTQPYVAATLQGAVSGATGPKWSVLQKPGSQNVAFDPDPPTALNPEVRLYEHGTYKFLLATDVGRDIVTVHVNKAPVLGSTDPQRDAIWSPSFALGDVTTDGLRLIAEAHDDGLPLGSQLRYLWECTLKPSGGDCILFSPRDQSTRIRFSLPPASVQETFRIKLTVSDGRLSSSYEKDIIVKPAEPPVISFIVRADSHGNALELFAENTDWATRYARVESINPTPVQFLHYIDTVAGTTPGPEQYGSADLELSGTVLRYTPHLQLGGPCERGVEVFEAIVKDRFGQDRSGKIEIIIVPTSSLKVQYEREHVFKFMSIAGEGVQEWNLRELLQLCPNADREKSISGTLEVGSPSIQTPAGQFVRINNSGGPPDNADKLRFTPTASFSGDTPLQATLYFRMEGMPGQARLDFLLLPTSLPAGIALGGLEQISTIEVDEELTLASFHSQIAGDAYWEYDAGYVWEVTRLDGPNPNPPITVTHPSYLENSLVEDLSRAKMSFPSPGTFKVTLKINSLEIGSTTIIVVPKGTLNPPTDDQGPFGDPGEPADTGLTPAVLVTKPGRAVILNLPDPRPNIPPFEIKDGYLTMKGQAAAPTDPDTSDGIPDCPNSPYDCPDASYRVFLYPADRGEEVPFEQDDSSYAIDLTPQLKFSGTRQLNLVSGWNRQNVPGTPGGDELGTVDLTKYTNGNYFVQLWVRGRIDMVPPNGDIQDTAIGKSKKYPILLNTERKPGKVQFSETDFTLAAADGRLRISRSYDSELAKPAGFTGPTPELGWGWSLSSFDLGVQLYEYRADVEEDQLSIWLQDDPEVGTLRAFNIRVKGPHHVTLNLPWNGLRVTFLQSVGHDRLPFWITPEGEGGRLEADESERRAFAGLSQSNPVQMFGSLSQYSRSQEQFDFSQFILTGPDGSKYFLTRGDPDVVTWGAWENDPMLGLIYPNPLALTKVEFPDGASMERAFATVGSETHEILKYYPTRAVSGVLPTPNTVTVVRNASGKITEIKSSEPPAGTSDTPPVVKYTYYQEGLNPATGVTLAPGDNRIGNLMQVKRLTRSSVGYPDSDYDVTTYFYKDSDYAHLVSKVINPLKLISFEAVWDTAGRLIKTADAAGIHRTVDHELTDGTTVEGQSYTDKSTVRVPYGNVTAEDYDAATSPKVKTVSKSDAFGNVLESRVTVDGTLPAGWPNPDVTATKHFDETRLASAKDAANRVTAFYYNADGRLEETRKPGGVIERIGYDTLGMPSTFSDARRNVSSSVYADGRLIESKDAKGNRTKTVYIESGEHRGKVDYVEDALGNRAFSEYYGLNDPDGKPGSLKSTYLLEKQPDGQYDPAKKLNHTTSKYYANGLLKTTESTRTGRNATGDNVTFTIKTEYEYDAQGRVTKTTQHPSNNPFTLDVDESAALHVTTQTYNALGKVSVSTDKYGRNTRYYYDNRGNLVQTLYPDNTITRTVYDVNNRPIYQQAAHLPASGDTLPFDDATTTFGTHTVYDAFGRAVKTEMLTAIRITLVQVNNDVNGQPVPDMYKAVFDSTVAATVLESTTTDYDNIGRVVKVIDATGSYRRFDYEDATASALAKKETFVGPGQGEIKIAEEEYDPNGNVVVSRTFDAGVPVSVNSFEYDELNRQTVQRVHTLDSSGVPTGVYSESKTTYDALGRRTQTTDADGKVTDFAYDGAGRLRSVTEYLNGALGTTPVVTEYTYDEVGNLIVQKDALGRETKYEYDNFGRRIHRSLPGGQTETLAYDVSTLSQLLESGQIVQRDFRTDFNSQITRRNYDNRGRLIWKGSGDGVNLIAAFTYTPWGARQTLTDLSGTTTYIYGRVGSYTGNPVPGTFTYDSDRLIIKQRVNNATPSSTDAFLYEHDFFGNLNRVNTKYTFTISGSTVTAVSSPNTSRTDVRYEYDWRNRLSKVRQGSDSTEVASYTYSDPGVLKQTTYTVPGLHHTYTYNAANQLLAAVIDRNGTQLRKFDYNPAGHELAKSGQRKAAWEYGAVGVLRREVNYAQDSLNRLVSEDIVSDSSSTAIGKVDYVYDNVGNRLSRQTPSTPLALKIPNFALPGGSTYDANDRLPAPEVYDNNGNTLKGDLDGLAGVEQTVNDVYDLEDRLTTSTRTSKTVTLAYDGDGNRTRKDVNVGGTVTATRYVVDERTPAGYAQVVEEWESVGGSAWTLTRKYTYGLSRIRQERFTGTPGTDYYGYDGHGNVALLTDTAGTVGNTYSYDAYGVLLSQGGNTPNLYQYSGEQWDSDLGMYYLRARYMNPQSGRFWTMDSFEGNSSTPLSLHKYLYVHNDPINFIDPSGHFEFNLISLLSATALQMYMRVAQVVAAHPIYSLAAVAGVSVAVPQLEAIPPGEPGPFDEMGQFGRAVRGTSSQAFKYLVRYFKSGRRPIPAASLLAGAGDELVEAAKWVTPRPGYYDIIVHGTEDAFHVLHNGQWVEVSHRSLATFMQKNGYNGGPVRLISCSSGGSPTGVAKNLANKLGAEVIAPSDTVWIHPSGQLTIGATEKANTGAWQTFTPGPTQ